MLAERKWGGNGSTQWEARKQKGKQRKRKDERCAKKKLITVSEVVTVI
jgi:hypothetical protein